MEIIWFITLLLFVIIAGRLIRKQLKKKQLQTVTQLERGTRSEHELILTLLNAGKSKTALFHDLYIPKPNNQFSQLDVVLATSKGIIVFEVKEYSGWIYGNAKHDQWTQVLAYGNTKYRFYNPVKQNQNHIKHLRKYLDLPNEIPFISVIVFFGDCELKEVNYVPKDTYVTRANRVEKLLEDIEENYSTASFPDKWKVVNDLNLAVMKGLDPEVQAQHAENIRDLVGQHRVYE